MPFALDEREGGEVGGFVGQGEGGGEEGAGEEEGGEEHCSEARDSFFGMRQGRSEMNGRKEGSKGWI